MAVFILAGKSQTLEELADLLRTDLHQVMVARDARSALDNLIIYHQIEGAIMDGELDVSRCAPFMQGKTENGKNGARFVTEIARSIGINIPIAILEDAKPRNIPTQYISSTPPHEIQAIKNQVEKLIAAHEKATRKVNSRKKGPIRGKGKKSVYIVSCEPDIVTLVEVTLEGEGYELHLFDDPEKALGAMQEKLPDLIIILNTMLPKMDGYELVKAIRRQWSADKVRILFAVSFGTKNHLQSVIENTNADGYIGKPFEPDKMRERVRTLLEK